MPLARRVLRDPQDDRDLGVTEVLEVLGASTARNSSACLSTRRGRARYPSRRVFGIRARFRAALAMYGYVPAPSGENADVEPRIPRVVPPRDVDPHRRRDHRGDRAGDAGRLFAQNQLAQSPALTEVPYRLDNMPNRGDVRTGFKTLLSINVSKLANTVVTPVANAKVDIWHPSA